MEIYFSSHGGDINYDSLIRWRPVYLSFEKVLAEGRFKIFLLLSSTDITNTYLLPEVIISIYFPWWKAALTN